MEVELWNGQSKAIVDPVGGWLTNLSDDTGDILFPRRLLKAADGTSKLRGGSHVCLPNFGPGGNSGQPQHGFGREVEWEVADKTDTAVLLKLSHGRDGYEELSAVLTYQLEEQGIVMTLEITNDGAKALRVAPAIHPYFATRELPVKINGDEQKLDELHEVQFIEGTVRELEAAGRTLTLESPELTVWAKWTDQLGPYVCVEPSLGGFTFLNDTPAENEVLKPGASKTYGATIRWE